MADPPERTPHTREIPRFEEVLLCAPAGDQPVAFIRTIKWTETGLMKRDSGRHPQLIPILFMAL